MILNLIRNSSIITLSSISGSFLYFPIKDLINRNSNDLEVIQITNDIHDKLINKFFNPGFFIGLFFGISCVFSNKLLLKNN